MSRDEKDEQLEQVRLLMEQRGWTYVELAEASGLSKNTVGDALSGRKIPHAATIRKMFDALDVPREPQGLLRIEGLPDDVRIFLTVAARGLSIMEQADRDVMIDVLYRRLFRLDGR